MQYRKAIANLKVTVFVPEHDIEDLRNEYAANGDTPPPDAELFEKLAALAVEEGVRGDLKLRDYEIDTSAYP